MSGQRRSGARDRIRIAAACVRARGLVGVMAVLVLCGVAARVGALLLLSSDAVRYHALAPVAILAPTVCAATISASWQRPAGDVEATAPRPVRLVLAAQSLTLLAVAALALAPAMWGDPGDFGHAALYRNLVGLTGLALAGNVLGRRPVGWVLPIAYSLVATMLGRDDRGDVEAWAWPAAPPAERSALVIAAVCMAAGIATVLLHGRSGRRRPRRRRASEKPVADSPAAELGQGTSTSRSST